MMMTQTYKIFTKPLKFLTISIIFMLMIFQSHAQAKRLVEASKPTIYQTKTAGSNNLVLTVGTFDPLLEELDFNKLSLTNKWSKKYQIVQFDKGKTDPEWLQKNGFKIVSYMANNAYVVVSNAYLNNVLTKNSSIRWHGMYNSAYKISPDLWKQNLHWQNDYKLVVALFKDYPLNKVNELIGKYLPHTTVRQMFPASYSFEVIANTKTVLDVVSKLSLIDSVQYIELKRPEKFFNAEAVSAIQGNLNSVGNSGDNNYTPINTPIFDKGIYGTGQIVGIADSGLDRDEDWFVHYNNGVVDTTNITQADITTPPTIGTLHPNNKVFGYFVMPNADAYDNAAADFHGTHVSGSVAGDREAAVVPGRAGSVSSPTNSGYDNDDGMAPGAQILFQDLGDAAGELSGLGSSPMWEQAYAAGVRIHSNSYGSESSGQYTFGDIFVDTSLRAHEDMLILFAAGNSRFATANSVGSPGVGKNVLTVGALGHGNSTVVATFSNRGPTDDGRIKPDVTATGTRIQSALGNSLNTNNVHFPSRAIISGTSMSTPITAGGSALLRQYFTDGFYPTGTKNSGDEHNPTGVLLKALLINGAGTDVGHFDGDTGWGRVNLSNSMMFDDSDKQLRVWEILNSGGLKTGESSEFKLEVKPDKELVITLAWYDVPGPYGSRKTLVNDLDLTVEVDGQIYKGNVFAGTAVSTTGGTHDNLNTVEQVRIPNPQQGVYTIKVSGASVPGNEEVNSFRQGFALVATGHLDNINTSPDTMTTVTNLTVVDQTQERLQLSWQGGDNADYYEIYRVEGLCSSVDFKNLHYVGRSQSRTFNDNTTLNGLSYAYKVRPAQHQELGELSQSCVDIVSTRNCDLIPSFNESSIHIEDNKGDTCHTKLQWDAATSSCPTNPNISYNIYRSLDRNFVPSAENLLATVATNEFDDIYAPDVPVYYSVRAEDDNPAGSGPNGGTETRGITKIRSHAVNETSTSRPLLEDVDTFAIMHLNQPWQVASEKSADGVLSYKTSSDFTVYPPNTCSSIFTNTITLPVEEANPKLTYKALFDLEENWDGVVVEVSTDNGITWVDLPPEGGYPGSFSETTANPVNACRYASTHGAFSGSTNGEFKTYSHDLSQYIDLEIIVRWRMSSDAAEEFDGFFLDSIQFPNIEVPNTCTVNARPVENITPQAGFYYDPSHNGHGFIIEPIQVGDETKYFSVFYSYKDDGTPEWYISLSSIENNVTNFGMNDNALKKYIYDFNVDPTGNANPNTLDTSDGTTNNLSFDFNQSSINASAACNDGTPRSDDKPLAVATWEIGDQVGEWCILPIIRQETKPTPDFGGIWWTGIDDDGWGMSLAFQGDRIIIAVYYFDSEGKPRWLLGIKENFVIGEDLNIEMKEYSGYGRNDDSISTSTTIAGNLTIRLDSNNGNLNDGQLSIDIDYQGTEAGNWQRSNVPISLFTNQH